MFNPEWLCDDVRKEYDRWMNEISSDPYASSSTLGIYDALQAHFLIANHFYILGEGLGGIGPRDVGLLHSALSRQNVSIGQSPKWSDKFDLCATLLFGLVMNHPFHDANKRTAFLCSLYLLERGNRIPDIPHSRFEDFLVEVADHKLGKYARFKEYIKKGASDPEVRFISNYLRTNTRQMDRRYYAVTYWDLKRTLNRFGCDIDHPSGNYIDVFATRHIPGGIFRASKKELAKVAQIGFPGWGKQVGQGALHTVRKTCDLTPEFGIDSQVFFNELDTLQALIAHYEEPLRRLANR
jgi:death-on-curing family protein